MNKLILAGFISVFGIISLTINAQALELDVYGGGTFSSVSYNPAPASAPSTKMGMIYGVGVGWSAMPGFGFETDLLMTKRKFGANAVTDLAAQYLQIPVIFKATMIPMVSFGAGLYYAKSLSDKLTQTTSGVDTEISFGSLNWNQSDFGWLLEAGGSFPLAPLLSFKVDLRYYMGFSSISTDTTRSDKWKGLDVLAGLSFGF